MKKQVELRLVKTKYGYIYVSVCDMTEFGDILVAPPISIEVEFDLYDEIEIRQKEIESIDNQIKEIREESLRKIIDLGNKKQELLALTHE